MSFTNKKLKIRLQLKNELQNYPTRDERISKNNVNSGLYYSIF